MMDDALHWVKICFGDKVAENICERVREGLRLADTEADGEGILRVGVQAENLFPMPD